MDTTTRKTPRYYNLRLRLPGRPRPVYLLSGFRFTDRRGLASVATEETVDELVTWLAERFPSGTVEKVAVPAEVKVGLIS